VNPLKAKILTVTAELLTGKEPLPATGSLSSVKSLEQCVAFIFQSRDGRNPIHTAGCRLKNEERDIFPEVIWDLFCARVIVPTSEAGALDKIRPHSDAAANWEKFKATSGVSD
jgi:hypothetical protein